MNEEVTQVIESTNTAVIATLLEDGSPYATPITYTFVDGKFSWWSAPDAVHSLNIARDGRVSLTVIEKGEGKVRAVYTNSVAVAGQETFNEQWQQKLVEYSVSLGEPDEAHSTPGRFYFKGTAS